MITLSLLKNIEELESIKITRLPIEQLEELHPDHQWVLSEYKKWAEKFPDYSPRLAHIIGYMNNTVYMRCSSKETILNAIKVTENSAQIDVYLPAIREERSSEKLKDLIEKILKVLKTGESDPDFAMG